MMSFSPKRIGYTLMALMLLLMLSACSFSLPTLGGVKGLPTGTPESGAAPGGADAEESPSATSDVNVPAGSDQPVGEAGISAEDFNDPENPPHGLILFTSTAEQPFQNVQGTTISNPNAERYLWAISTDGVRAGRVSPEGMGTALFVPEASSKKSKVLANGFQSPGEQIEPVQMPEECGEAGGASCSGFQFSYNGNMLAYFKGPDSCGRVLTLYDITAQKQASTWQNVHWAYFFENGSLIFALGDCESQTAYLYYPNTGKQAGVAKVGKAFWNPTHTAVIFQVQGEPEMQSGLWGFHLETSKVFMWPSKEMVIEDTPIWLADGDHFVFQHQPFKYDKSTKDAILNGPRQIVLMNARTRSQSLLAFDARSNYHLCGAADLADSNAVGLPCEQTYDTWLHVLRQPYQSVRFPAAERTTPAVRCALYGLDCEDAPEILALDWQTGKQYPWEEARVPEATATPGAHRPDLDKEPFYQDPEGEFAFYLGQSGKTLWYVPRDREPTLWVQDGENFLYLP